MCSQPGNKQGHPEGIEELLLQMAHPRAQSTCSYSRLHAMANAGGGMGGGGGQGAALTELRHL